MKLGVFSGIFHPEAGGPATYLNRLLPELQGRGWDVRAVTYGDANAKDYGYPVTRIARRALPLRLLDYARDARPALAWADLAYIHTLGLPLIEARRHAPHILKIVGDQAWERAVRRGWIPAAEDIDDFQTRAHTGIVALQKTLRAREARSMDGIIVPSEYLKRMVVGWGVDAAKVTVIYNAHVDSEQPLSQTEARAQFGIEADAKLLLTVARLMPWKGVQHLIAALEAVPDVHLLVAGDGPMLAELQQAAQSTPTVKARVRFLGQIAREQVAVYMKAADYVVLYSGYEGLPHTLLESLSMGTPVIASSKGGNVEVVQHGVNGLLVPYVDVDKLTAAIDEAFRLGVRAALAANHTLGMERFDFAGMVARTDQVLRGYL